MKPYEHSVELPRIGETFTTHDSTYTVLAAKLGRMLLVRYNWHTWCPVTYVVAHYPEAMEGSMGERDFHWAHGSYYDVSCSEGGRELASAIAEFNEG